MQSAISREQITDKVWQIINGLPQREAIVEGDARHWVAEVVERYDDLSIWHAIRAGGFGGSQIGALVRNHCGQRADHQQSAHDIVEGALLRRLPDEPNGQMRRGVAMEPQHRQWFYEKHGAVRDTKGFETLSKNTGPRPWMRYSPDDLVFTSPQGDPLRASNFRRDVFTPAARRVGLTGLVPHSLRHTAASLAIAAGADVKVVQQMLGHKSATMTLDLYGHLFDDRLDEVAEALDRAASRTAVVPVARIAALTSGAERHRSS